MTRRSLIIMALLLVADLVVGVLLVDAWNSRYDPPVGVDLRLSAAPASGLADAAVAIRH